MTRAAPPPGAPWDLPLAEAPLAFLDLEMSGLDVARDRVLEVCAQRVVGERVVAELTTLVRPDPYVFGAGHVHGIDETELRAAPTLGEVWPRLLEVLEGAVFVAHGARWDLSFLRREAELLQRELPVAFYLDTLNLSRRAFLATSHSLEALTTHLGLQRTRAHRAADDVAVLRQLFVRCASELKAKTPRDLFEVRVAERVARSEVLAGCRAALATGQPLSVVYRPSRKKPETLSFRVTAVHDEPPVVQGYELPSRSRRELRAERILSIEPPEPAAG